MHANGDEEESDLQAALQDSVRMHKKDIQVSRGMVSLTYKQQIQLLTRKLASSKRKVLDVANRGNCLFDAVRLQYNLLSDQPERSFMASTQSLRDMIASWLRANQDWLVTICPAASSQQTLDAYCRRIATDGVWGDAVEIIAIASLLRCSVGAELRCSVTLVQIF